MPLVAIVQLKSITVDSTFHDYAYLDKIIASKITEWTEVDEETLNTLINFQNKFGYLVIKQPTPEEQREIILTTVYAYQKMIEEHKKIEEKYKEEKAKKKKERDKKKLEKQLKTKKAKREMLERLKEELKEELGEA